MNIKLLAYTQGNPALEDTKALNPEEVVETCGRTCYNSPAKDGEVRSKFLKSIVKNGHTAVIEHASATFMVEGVSRALTHQLVRHRHFSFCQRSQRYVKETTPEYVTPFTINDNPDAASIYSKFMDSCWETYTKLFELGVKKEDARFVLPNAAHTTICVTGNFRQWHQFLDLRLDPHAQWEIRALAKMFLDELMKIAPNVFDDLVQKYFHE